MFDGSIFADLCASSHAHVVRVAVVQVAVVQVAVKVVTVETRKMMMKVERIK